MSDYSAVYDPDTDFDAVYTRATARRITGRIRPGELVLEAGCATGLMTAALAATGARVVALDRSGDYLERLVARGLPDVEGRRCDLDTDPLGDGPYDHVVATNLLHELSDPGGFMVRAADVLAAHGLMHVSVPNPGSLHRLVALEMGWLPDAGALSTRAERFATRRMLTLDDIHALAAGAGLEIASRAGIVCKPLPNDLMAGLPEAVIEGLDRVAHRVPDLCAMTLVELRHA